MITAEKNDLRKNEQPELETVSAPSESISINPAMTQFEVINALYDSEIFSKVKLTAGARLVLIALARHYNPANEDFFPSYNCISAHTGVSRKSVERAIKELVGANLITYRTQKVNRYRFTGHFFACVKMTLKHGQNDAYEHGQNDGQTKKIEKINNKKNFSKKTFLSAAQPQEGQAKSLSTEALTETSGQLNLMDKSSYMSTARGFSPNSGQNDAKRILNLAESTRTLNKGGFSYEKRSVTLEGGGSRVPTVAETERYLRAFDEARKTACAPCDFEPEAAIAWYNSLNPILKTSNMAKKVAQKYSLTN